jgi:hypothetical protein
MEYEKVGTARAPVGATNAGELVDRIESRPVSGDFYVYFPYGIDGEICEDLELRLDLEVPDDGVCCPIADEGCSIEGPMGGWARSADECRPAMSPVFDAAFSEQNDAHDCPRLVSRPDLCCGCYHAENALLDCFASEPCAAGRAEMLEGGSREVAWDAVTCIMTAVASSNTGRYAHETVSSFGNEAIGARHTFYVHADSTITYSRVLYSTASGVIPIEVHEPAVRCQIGSASFFSACMDAIAADPESEEAFLCAFGDGTTTSPSQLEWLTDCSEAEASCN